MSKFAQVKMMSSLKFMSNPAIPVEWLDGHPAFESGDGGLVRGYLRMLRGAIQAEMAGVLPSTSHALAEISGLKEQKVIECWEILTHGWMLTADGNLQHDGVARRCESFARDFSEEIAAINSRVVALEGAFEISASGHEPKPVRSKQSAPRALPKSFALSDSLSGWLELERGIASAVQRQFLFDKFIERSRLHKHGDWDAAFKSSVPDLLSVYGLPPATDGSRPVFGSRARANQKRQVAQGAAAA